VIGIAVRGETARKGEAGFTGGDDVENT
jgi:hypothetical protein